MKLLLMLLKNSLKKILEITYEKLVSIDFNHNSASAIIDASLTSVVGSNMGKISAWYDNEWGFQIGCVILQNISIKSLNEKYKRRAKP